MMIEQFVQLHIRARHTRTHRDRVMCLQPDLDIRNFCSFLFVLNYN